jgi:RNA polymerase sigma-70 factor (ECF subfamily)
MKKDDALSAGMATLAASGFAPSAFRDFYRDNVEFVWRTARRLGVSDGAVDDVVQHVFLVAHRRYDSTRLENSGPRWEKAWLFAILTRTVREYRRSNRRKSPHLQSPHTDPETLEAPGYLGPDEAFTQAEAARIVRLLLEQLDQDKREVFVLGELQQFTMHEIAEALGIKASTASTRLRAARRTFERAALRYLLAVRDETNRQASRERVNR